MRRKIWILTVVCLLALAAAWFYWPQGGRVAVAVKNSAAPAAPAGSAAATKAAAVTAPKTFSVLNTNALAFRLGNTPKSLCQLAGTRHAILLANALIDTDARLDLKIPANLKAKGDPGAYIVQARGVIDARFRAQLAAAGAQTTNIVSYIPNNAYLVRLSSAGAAMLAGSALVQAVLPYEPYYKLQPSLLGLAVAQEPLPPGMALNLGVFAADENAVEIQLAKLHVPIIGRDRSAFDPVLRVLAPADWPALAQLPGVHVMEPAHARVTANDLSRVTLGVSPDTTSGSTNDWLGLTGLNVLVAVNDTGIDATHPDFTATGTAAGGPAGPTRVIPNDSTDTDGHGTHVAGIIAGNGAMSINPTNVGSLASGSVTNADFRGKAPLATLFSMNMNGSDQNLQEAAAQTNALISNNSWDYGRGAAEYDLAAASYDAATRDALPGLTGSQPVLFVFAAGNNGGGNSDGAGGAADTIMSPGTAKNVITVGALEQLRNITNIVTLSITPAFGTNAPTTNQSAYWQPQTDSGSQVASYSSRGNVGVGTEGSFGRFKPDVVAPGNFVVSTRSTQWDTNAYYNPTNVQRTDYTFQIVATNSLVYYSVSVPPNAISVVIGITPNKHSPSPFPADLPIYVQQSGFPDPVNAPGSIDITTHQDGVSIPPDSGGAVTGIQAIQNNGFSFAVGNSNNISVNYDLFVEIRATNNVGDRYQVLEGMNDRLGGSYRYESGTSMAAAAVSGVLALLDDYFTNKLSLTPSPALLKAILINGSRSVGSYTYGITNGNNFQGWGLPSLPNSLPLTTSNLTVIPNGVNPMPLFFVDQSPLTALATGDAHTYLVTVNTNSDAQFLQLQATLVWTDPPGDPAAAIKLVNNLDLVITNLETGDVYFGNDISPDVGYNRPWNTNAPPNLDTINNVENILLPPLLAGTYSVTVVGRAVNVNAVTAHTNNVVQDYALVISCGEGEVPDALTVTDIGSGLGLVSNPTADQLITFVTSTNSPLFNQFVGANTPLLGTNNLPLGTNTVWGPNGVVRIGMTNQWHFYVVTNTGLTADVTNAAFITFNPDTLSIPRMGVYESSVANATRPSADIDLYATTDSGLTNLNPVTISNCLAGANNSRASLGQGGTEFVFYTNSTQGQVYYIGVKSEDQMASEYAFLPVFTSIPFSQLDQNGNQIVNGLVLPVNIPDGNNAHPGVVDVFALAVLPMDVEQVTVINLDEHQNFGDLFGALTFGGQSVVLNNHDGFGNTFGTAPLIYDDSRNPVAGTQHSDGPGNLMNFQGMSALGPWILSAMDNSLTMTGQVSQFSLFIQPHRNLTGPGIIITVPAGGWFIDYVDVPPGYTNLTFFATNLPPTAVPPIRMYEKLVNEPTLTDFDQEADLTNCIAGTYPGGTLPGNSISIGPPLDMGRYFVGLYNPGLIAATNVFLSATLGIDSSASDIYNYTAGSGQTLFDDAVSASTIAVPFTVTQLVASVNVGLVIKSPRISDYAFTLVSPTGQRVLLMENRGGWDTNGAGTTFVYTNILNSTATGGAAANTNYLTVSPLGGTVPITYNFYTVPDRMTVYQGTIISGVNLLWDTGFTNNPPNGGPGPNSTVPVTINVPYPPGYTNITIIMNQDGNPFASGGDAWIYTAGATVTNYQYLVFTDDTNLATVPIKFAQPPYNFTASATNYVLSDFELATNGDYFGLTTNLDGWTVPTNLVTYTTIVTNNQFQVVTNVTMLTNNLVSVVTDPADSVGDNVGSNFLALAKGTITRSIPTSPGRLYNVTFWYRGPGIAGWWRGEGNASDSSDPENNDHNGVLVGRFNFPAGEVGQAFQFEDQGDQFGFAGTNTYVQIPQSPSLDVGKGGGFTIEGWINPTNLVRPQPLVEWLAHVPTNAAVTNIIIQAGPYLNRATGHYYYLLGATNWTTSELWATQLGGHLATIDTANEQNWVFDNFADYGGVNRNLWIGLTNNAAGNFVWSSGLTNITYTNWLTGQPLNCDGTRNYTFIRGETNLPSGLWVLANTNGFVCGSAATNKIYGVVEVNDIQTNGVQFWISVTNSMPGGTNTLVSSNGCLYANIMDTNFVSHEIFSAPGLLQSNVYQHVALTYNTNSGLAALYLNGTNVASTNLGVFVPKTDGDVLLGRDMTLYTNNYYGGKMDEMSIYSRALSLAEISAIYQVSASTTNRLIGKFDPSVTPAVGLAEAEVSFGTTSNLIFGVNNQWEVNSFTFTATSNSMPLQITGLEPGILLDSFAVSEAPETNLYYLPEQALAALKGNSAAGPWTLQVWDNRVGAYVTNFNELVNWQLSFVLQSNATIAATLAPQTPTASTVAPGSTVYYAVDVPSWAHYATNILVSSTLTVDLLFNPTNPPTGSNPGDIILLNGSTGGSSPPITVNTNAPFAPYQAGQTYYLGVRNSGTHAASVVLEVDYDITALTNGIPYTSFLNTNDAVRYFSFDVSSNAYEATFQLLKLSSNADLVVRKGPPLPTLTSSDYGSFNVSNLDENIFVLTNSSPVPLSAGRWYLGVVKRDSGVVNYTILAKELDVTNASPTIIDLTNGVPFNWTAGPGAALTNFFRFHATNSVVGGVTNYLQGLRFELYNLSGNGDLTVQTNAWPLSPPFFQTSQNPGRSAEMILIFTNNVLTNLVADWYLGVPSHETNLINYTIIAEIQTNSYFPAFPGAAGAGGGALGGGSLRSGFTNNTVYHVTTTSDSGPGSLRDAVNTTNRTVVFDISGTVNLASPLVITNSYLTIAGQTAPGGGITVAGQMTIVQSAHDVVIRDVRFRRGAIDDSLMLTNVANVIADHVSAEWSDTAMSTLNSSNVTVQWSILADSLYLTNNPPPLGSLLRYGGGALSFHHNLYADNYSGSPRLGDNISLDFVNNVIYNWGIQSGFSSTNDDLLVNPNGFTNQLNYVCNYLIAGADTAAFATNFAITNIAFWGGTTNTWIFQTNNFIDSNTNRILDGGNTQWAMFTNKYTPFGRPFPLLPVPTDEAFLAYEKVLDFAGVNLTQRDPVDANIVTGVRNQTGRLISAPPVLSGSFAWWPAEGNANEIIGGTTGVVKPGTTYSTGVIGQAFSFDGVNGCVMNTNTPSMTNIQNTFTMAFWAYPQKGFSIQPEGGGSGLSGQSYAIFPDWGGASSSGPAGVGVCVGTNGISVVEHCNNYMPSSLSYTNPMNGWVHVAVVYLNKQPTLYVNGVNVRTGVTSSETFVYPSKDFGGSYGNAFGNFQFKPYGPYKGLLDEVKIYNRALSATEIQAIYNAGIAGGNSTSSSPLLLDTDQDGIPDYWEITFGENPTNASNNLDRDGDGYTDLEEYLNWLAAPHALTVTNTPVSVDLMQLFGKTGNLSFSATNGVNGFVYLTNVLGSVTKTGPFSNSIAVFMPTNSASGGTNFYGYAAFDVYVTNTDTVAYFGPVTVSVVVSAVPIAYVNNTNSPPVLATNLPNLTINELTLLTVTNTATDANTNLTLTYTVTMSIDTVAMTANGWPLTYATTIPSPVISTNGIITWTPSEAQGPGVYIITTIVSDNGIPPLTATNSFSVTVNEVNTAPVLPAQTNLTISELTTLVVTNTATDSDIPPNPLTYTVTMSIDTVAMTANGWPLTYATTIPSPVISNNGIITWTPSEAQGPGVYTFTTIVTDTNAYALTNQSLSATNSFTVTVEEVNTAPFWPPGVPSQTNYTVAALSTLVVTNTATDSDIPPNPLTYQLIGPLGALIDPTGIITWTPTLAQAPGLYTFTTIVTDTNAFALVNQSLSATNVFTVFVTSVFGPFAFTQPATLVTGTSAQLNGMATPNGLPATAWFQWGTNALYGNQTPPVSVGSGYNVVYTSDQITGLVTNVPYHFRLVASNAVGVVTGFDQILDEANVVVWGANYVGQATVPPGLSNVVAIAGAYDHSLALKNNGTAVGWGDNTFGQATVPAGLNNVVAVAGGAYYSLALKNSGTVAAWGANILGQTNVPAGLNNVVEIAGGTYSSLALRNDGTVVAWGASFFNLTNVPASLSNAVALAGGSYHSLAIKNDGTVMAWGDNSAGQLNLPAGLTNVVAIAGGSYHSLALKNNGTVVAWGDNSAGQTDVPAGLNHVVAVAGGGFHSLVLQNDGTVVAWGDNTAGQTSVPVGLSNVVAIASGYFHSLALTPLFNVNPINPVVLNLTNGVPQTNSIFAGGITYYRVNVPTNADFATNILLFTLNGPLNVWFSTNAPPSITTLLLAGVTNGSSILSTSSAPTNIVPGAAYYLGVQNTNSFAVAYGIEVDFHLLTATNPPPQTNSVPISSIIYTNGGILLIWFAPSNDLFQVEFSDALVPATWIVFTNIISYNTNAFTNPTNTQFNFFDDGVEYPFTGLRFYQLILLGLGSLPTNPPPGLAPALPFQTNRIVNPLNTLVVTNTATDAAVPPPTLSYALTSTVTGANVPVINTNTGVITWTPDVSQSGTSNSLTTIVTASGVPPLSATNTFAVIVNPLPDIGSVTYTNGGYLLTWFAPSNDLFQVEFTATLASATWNRFTNIISYNTNAFTNPTNTQFNFFDDGVEYPFTGLRFYRLILLGLSGPAAPSSNTPPVLSAQGTRVLNPLNPLVVTNMATDAAVPAPTLTYTLASTVSGTNKPVINPTNGVITWTPDLAQSGTSNNFTTIVTASGVPSLSATNAFAVIVNPLPDIGSVTYTNGSYLLTWWAPTNDLFKVQFTDSLAPANWQSFSNIIAYTGPVTTTNGLFTFLDDGTQYPFTGLRFYRLILLGVGSSPTNPPSGLPPVLPFQTNRIVNPLNPLVVTNTATDGTVPAPTLTYTLTSTVAGTNVPVINATNGVITWTPDVLQAGTSNVLTTIVTASGVPVLSATNMFAVIVNPLPDIGSVTYTNGNYLLTWWAPTNDLFRVEFKDNLLATNWQSFSNIIAYTGPVTPTNGLFTFLDDGTQHPFTGLRFYRLKLVGLVMPANPPPVTNTVSISSIVFTNSSFRLAWSAPTNDQFKVQWATNIVPPFAWNTFSGIITSTNGIFSFTDTNAPWLMKFYQLVLSP